MMCIWTYLFNGATFAVFAGLFFLAYAVFQPEQPLIMITVAAMGLVAFGFYQHHFGPRLGSED